MKVKVIPSRCCHWNSRRLAKLSVIRLIRCQLDDSVKLTVWLARKLTFSLELRHHQIKLPKERISLIYTVSFLPIMLPIQVSESTNSVIKWMLHPIAMFVMPILFEEHCIYLRYATKASAAAIFHTFLVSTNINQGFLLHWKFASSQVLQKQSKVQSCPWWRGSTLEAHF